MVVSLGSLGRGVLEPMLWFPVCGGWLAMGVAVRQPPVLWFGECRSSRFLNEAVLESIPPLFGQRGVWEEVKTMANVLNLQTDVVEVTQEAKVSRYISWRFWCW